MRWAHKLPLYKSKPSDGFKKAILGIALSLAATLVAANLASLMARSSWITDLFSHFAFQYFIGAIILGIVFALLRQWVLLALMLVLMTYNGWEILPKNYTAAEPATVTMHPVTVMTYNRLFLQFKHDDLKAFLLEKQPDIVLLQEANARLLRMAKDLSATYPHMVDVARNDAFGAILLSKYPLSDLKSIAMPSDIFENYYIRATIHYPGIRPIVFYAMHTIPPVNDEEWKQRNAELKTIGQAIAAEKDSVILFAGDWNISPYSPFFHDLLKESGMSNRMSAQSPHRWTHALAPPTWPSGFVWPLFQTPIDHILHSPAVALHSRKRYDSMGSDHYPIISTYQIPAFP